MESEGRQRGRRGVRRVWSERGSRLGGGIGVGRRLWWSEREGGREGG